MTVLCGYCGAEAEIVSGDKIYPHRPDLAGRNFYLCTLCDAWVGCHAGTTKPLGRLAKGELRRAKRAAHAAFDPLWKAKMRRDRCSKKKARSAGYRWLAEQLEIPPKECHIGMFDISTCWRVVEICRQPAAPNRKEKA